MENEKGTGLNIGVKSFITAIIVVLVLMILTYGLSIMTF